MAGTPSPRHDHDQEQHRERTHAGAARDAATATASILRRDLLLDRPLRRRGAGRVDEAQAVHVGLGEVAAGEIAGAGREVHRRLVVAAVVEADDVAELVGEVALEVDRFGGVVRGAPGEPGLVQVDVRVDDRARLDLDEQRRDRSHVGA